MFAIDVASGAMVLRSVDLGLPGPIPIALTRFYLSGDGYQGLLGRGWRFWGELFLRIDEERIALHSAEGVEFEFVPPSPGTRSSSGRGKLELENDEQEFIVEHPSSHRWFFPRKVGRNGISRIDRIEDRNGNRIQFAYTRGGRLVGMADGLDRRISFNYSGERIAEVQVASPENPGQVIRVVSYHYDRRGDLVQVQDAAGKKVAYRYRSHFLVAATDRIGGERFFQYDQEGRCADTWLGDGSGVRSFEYNGRRSMVRSTDSMGYQRVYKATPVGDVLEEAEPNGEMRYFTYDAERNRIGSVHPEGRLDWFVIDDREKRSLMQISGEDDLSECRFGEDARLRELVAADGSTWQVECDEYGQPVALVSPFAGRWFLARDGRGRIAEVTTPEMRRIRFKYDDRRQVLRVEDDLGLICTCHCDLFGRLVEKVDGLGRRWVWSYDAVGRTKRIELNGSLLIQVERDEEGNASEMIGAGGQRTGLKYDRMGRLLGIEKSDGSEVELGYDTENRVIVWEGMGEESGRCERDWRGRVIRRIDAGGIESRFEYEDGGFRVVERIGEEEVVSRFDARMKLLRQEGSDGSWNEFAYGPGGQLLIAENAWGTVLFEYDDEGRLSEESHGASRLSFAYDADGNRTGVEDDTGRRVELSYDARCRLVEANDGGRIYRFTHDEGNRLIGVVAPSGMGQRFVYDERDRLVERRITGAGGERIEERQFVYAPAGLLVEERDAGGGRWSYAYDEKRRLHRIESEQGEEVLLRYDAQGRLSYASSLGQFRYGWGGRLERAGKIEYGYDDRGILQYLKAPEGEWEYCFDALRRLQSVKNGRGDVWQFHYDALGRRVLRTGGEEEMRWSWCGDRIWSAEHGEGGYNFLILGGLLFGADDGTEVYSLSHIRDGMVDGIYDGEGFCRWRMRGFSLPGRMAGEKLADLNAGVLEAVNGIDERIGLQYREFRYCDFRTGRSAVPPFRDLGADLSVAIEGIPGMGNPLHLQGRPLWKQFADIGEPVLFTGEDDGIRSLRLEHESRPAPVEANELLRSLHDRSFWCRNLTPEGMSSRFRGPNPLDLAKMILRSQTCPF